MRIRLHYEDLFGPFPFLEPLGNFFMRFSPFQLSITSFIAAILGGAALFLGPNFLVLTAFFWWLNLLLDSVDGYIARKTGQASRVGDFMDHTLDRFSDIVIFLSIIYSPYIAHRIFGYLALVSILLLSCIGQEGKALGVPREFISPASRIIRMFILMTAPLIVFVLLKLNIEYIIANYTFFDLLMILFIFLACISIIMRAWMILRGVKLNP